MPILESPIKIPMKLEVTPDGIKMGLGNTVMPKTVIIDDELSLESENPVQNKVITAALNEKVDSEGAAAAAPVQSVSGKTGDVELVKSDVGLGNVDNTSDLDKPVSTAQAQALDGKLSKTGGSMTGPIAMGDNKITGLQQGTSDTDAVNVAQMASAISQGAAYFRGSFATKADLLAVAWQTSDPEAANYVTNNDYAIVLADETHSNECWRYLYVSGDGWTAQYRINESPFTQAQLDAINSGATQALISAIPGKQDALTFDTEPTYNSTNPVTSDGIHVALDEKTTYEDLYDVYPLMYSAGSENEFNDGADDVPFESFKVTINPVQNGSGTPSPTNVRAISGWTEVRVYHETEVPGNDYTEYIIDLAPYVPDGVVYSGVLDLINWKLTVDRVAVDLGSLSWSKTGTKFYHPWDSDDPLRPDANLTPSPVGKAANALCSQYEASSYTALATKDYGFTLYKTLGKSRVYVTDSRYSTTDAFKAGVNGVTLVYPLATPIVYDISDYDYEFKSAYGLNIITATTGDNEVGYRAALELILAKTDQNFASVEPIKRASKNYSSGDLIVVQHRLYRAISSIANKQPLVPGSNISETNIEQEFTNHEKITYITTDATYSEVRSMVSVQHKSVALIDGEALYFCTDYDNSNNRFVFTALQEEKVNLAYLDTSDEWTYGTKLLADSFFATYNVTTFAEIADAVANGKIVYCKKGSLTSTEYYILGIEDRPSEYTFYGFINYALQTVTCDDEDDWTSHVRSVPLPATVAPRALGTAAVGTSTKYAKEDHVHRLPTASEVGAYELPSGGIPKTDLASGVKSSLDLADSAYQKPSGGIPATDLASDVQASLGKADTALQSAPVTSVDGKTGAVTILPTGGTIGQSLEKASGNNYQVKWGNKVPAGVVDTLNPFSPVLDFLPRIDRLENALYFADKRWTVTGYKEEIATGIQTELNASSLANLFDFNSSSNIGVADGYKIVVTMDFGSPDGIFPNYPYGVLCISFYYNNSPASVSARVYGKHTGNTWYWSDLTVNDVSADGTHIQYQANQSRMYNMQKLEVTVVGQAAGSSPGYTQINDISYYLNRGTKDNDMPYVSKLRAEKLYYDLTVPNVLLTDGKNVKTLLESIPSAATATPANLGTAAVGSSSKYAKEDHVHNKPTYSASDVGAVASNQGVANAGKFLAVGNDGIVVPVTVEVTIPTDGAVTQALDAGKIYHFTGDLTALTITLNSASVGQLAQYHFDFDCGSTPPTVTIPNTVTMPDYQSYIANKHYEIDILNGYGVVVAWTLS